MDQTALFKLTYGLYIVSSSFEGRRAGCVINTALQVSSAPARLSVTVSKNNFTHDIIKGSGLFALSALTQDVSMDVIRLFGFSSSREADKFSRVDFALDGSGAPYLRQDCAARFSCRVEQSVDLGTHTMFIGLLTEAENLSAQPPLTYADYHLIKKGGTPKNAPSFQLPTAQPTAKKEETTSMKKYVCTICGFIYDEAVEGVKFDDLPEDYVCPACGASKDNFEEIKD